MADPPPTRSTGDDRGVGARDTGFSLGWEGCDDRRSTAAPAFCTTWHLDGVQVQAAGGPGAYKFGLVETADCEDCWTGEDCVYGYDAGGPTLHFCHDAGDVGTTLAYGGDRQDLRSGQTAFPGPEMAGRVTYYMESLPELGGDGSCYIWGHDPTYYDGLGCSAVP